MISHASAAAALYRLGTYAAAGQALGVSRQRIHQIIKREGVEWGGVRTVRLWCPWPRRGEQRRARAAAFETKFWGNVEDGFSCRIWRGARFPSGYGHVTFRGRSEYAHRTAWILCNGPIPAGMWILHTCDNPPCVNPDHLVLGTARDNALDRERKHRGGHHRVRFVNPTCPYGHRRVTSASGRWHCPTCKAAYDAQRYGRALTTRQRQDQAA